MDRIVHFILLVTVQLCLYHTCGAASAPVVGHPTVTLPGSAGATITGETIDYDEPDFLGVKELIDVYRGVPFAEPPLEDLRFTNPVPYEAQGDYNATINRDICPQVNLLGQLPDPFGRLAREMSEDCLYLNIYAPSPKPTTAVPVFVWIHGGGYIAGAGSQLPYEGIPLVAYSGIIVVSINYRLGVFGFLTTGDDAAVGNYGMMDQVLALQWIQQNIAAFGGDPQQVTIAGESAGAGSVSHHMLSPLSRGLFHQTVMQSGNSACPWSWTTQEIAAEAFRNLASEVNCPVEDSEAMVDCLRTVDADLLIRQQNSQEDRSYLSRPVVDGIFMPDDPVELIKRGRFQVLPTLMGTNEDEATFTAMFMDFPDSFRAPPHINITHFRDQIPITLFNIDTPDEIAAIEHQYIDWSMADNATFNHIENYIRMDTDQTFSCPTEYYARTLESAGAQIYRYEMTHDPVWSVYFGLPTWTGAAHLEDVPFVFAWGLNPTMDGFVGQTDEEKVMSIEFMRYWTNFVKSGNPNEPITSSSYPEWPRFTVPEQEYKKLSLSMANGRAMRAADCSFWLNYMPQLRAQTDPFDMLYDDWKQQYELWKNTDVPSWATEFEKYKQENTCPVQ